MNNSGFGLYFAKRVCIKVGLHGSVLLLLLLSAGCSRSENGASGDYSFDAVPSVDVEEIHAVAKGHLFINPFDLLLVGDSLLVVSTMDKHYQFELIHLHQLTVKQTGKLGMGPGEISFPTNVYRLPGSSSHFTLNIRPRFKVCKVTIDEFINDYLTLSDCSPPLPTGFQKVVYVENGVYVGFGLFPGRYAVANGYGEIVRYFGDYPAKEPFNIRPPYSAAMAYQGVIDIRPDGKRLVSTVKNGVILEILEIKGTDLRYISRIADAYPEFKDQSTGSEINVDIVPQSVKGFIDIYTTQHFIAALFSGKSVKDRGELSDTGKCVYIFDWEGRSKIKIQLPDDVLCIAVDERMKTLYGITYGENPGLKKYGLPDGLIDNVLSEVR